MTYVQSLEACSLLRTNIDMLNFLNIQENIKKKIKTLKVSETLFNYNSFLALLCVFTEEKYFKGLLSRNFLYPCLCLVLFVVNERERRRKRKYLFYRVSSCWCYWMSYLISWRSEGQHRKTKRNQRQKMLLLPFVSFASN